MSQIMTQQQPAKPVKLADQVALYAADKRAEIVAFAGSEERADKFIADMRMLCTDPALAPCKPVTIFLAALNALQLRLSIVKQTGQAWVLPYNNKVKGQDGRERTELQAQLQLGYKGWQLICKRAGYNVDCELVFMCDDFEQYMDETGRKIRLKANYKERKTSNSDWVTKNLVGAIVWVTDQSGTSPRFVPEDKLAKLRSTSKAPNSPAWKVWAEEMYKGKAIKYVASKLPSENEELFRAVDIDNQGHTLEPAPVRTFDLIPDLPALDAEADAHAAGESYEAEAAPEPLVIICPDKNAPVRSEEDCKACPKNKDCPELNG